MRAQFSRASDVRNKDKGRHSVLRSERGSHHRPQAAAGRRQEMTFGRGPCCCVSNRNIQFRLI